jgi:Amt family ammonium transporter
MAAEDTELLIATGKWLLLQACRQLRAWDLENPGREPLSMSVNISGRQFAHPRFVTDLQSAVREAGIETSRLQVEVTETVAASDPKLTTAVFTDLRRCGVAISLTHFEGSSSLSGLRSFQVQTVKISPSLVSGMSLDLAVRDTVELIILLAHKLKFKVVADGIESAKQVDSLRELGSDLGQGHVFSQPVEAAAAGQLLRQRSSMPHAKAAGS